MPKAPAKGNPNCPECDKIMGKAGYTWSGRNRRQIYKCSGCGRITMVNPNDNGNGTGHKPPRLASATPTPKLAVKPTTTPTNTGMKLCDGDYVLDNVKHHCRMSEDGHCIKRYFPLSCPIYKKRDDWESLPTS